MSSLTTHAPKGLEGVVATTSSICFIDGEQGVLAYRGIDIHELADHSNFEEVCYLLWYGKLPTRDELRDLRQRMAEERKLDASIIYRLQLAPKHALPMDVLRTIVSALSFYDPEEKNNDRPANLNKAIRLTSQIAMVVAAYDRIRKGKPVVEPDRALSHAANFLWMLNGTQPSSTAERALDIALILHADHELNASTFAARVTAATLSDMHSAVTSAIGALKGPLHGGANEEALEVLKAIGSPERVDAWVHERLERKEKIMGFGHRVYRTGDSRVPAMRELARQLGERTGETFWLPVCEKLEETMAREKNLCANVDLYAAVVLRLMGFPAALNPAIFALSRVAGWCAHITEQHDHNRLIRPRSIYTGPERRKVKV